jgi:Mrp family chromosome partitioning ATPase
VNSILAEDKEPNLAFQGILHSIFQRLESGEGIVLAFTSAKSGEGVSYVGNMIASQLAENNSESVRFLSATELRDESWPAGLSRFDGFGNNKQMVSRTGWEDLRSKVTNLRSRYRYSIIDCPALSASGDVLSLAPHLDGIVIVVAANDTQKSQVKNVERQIKMVNGKILGYVLNKRKYIVPDWLYNRL